MEEAGNQVQGEGMEGLDTMRPPPPTAYTAHKEIQCIPMEGKAPHWHRKAHNAEGSAVRARKGDVNESSKNTKKT